jgi:hypothetical protein
MHSPFVDDFELIGWSSGIRLDRCLPVNNSRLGVRRRPLVNVAAIKRPKTGKRPFGDFSKMIGFAGKFPVKGV